MVALQYGAWFDFPAWVTRCGVLPGAGQFGTPALGTRTFGADRCSTLDSTSPAIRSGAHFTFVISQPCSSLKCDPMRQCVFTDGGGTANTISLSQLTTWCDERFGRHVRSPNPEQGMPDVSWVAMESRLTGELDPLFARHGTRIC